MGSCPIPTELWDMLVPAGLPAGLRGVCLPDGKGYPSAEIEVMVVVLRGQGVFAEVQLRPDEVGGPNCAPFVIPKNDIKASIIMDCTPGSAMDPQPAPSFILAGRRWGSGCGLRRKRGGAIYV